MRLHSRNWRLVVQMALLVSLAGRAIGGHAAATTALFVATNGSDSWSGRLAAPNRAGTDGPFATLERARDAVRAIEDPNARAVVYLRKGTYFLKDTFVLGPMDSRAVTFTAYKGENVNISGGRPITGFKPVEVNGRKMLAADVPDVKTGEWNFTQLFVNGRRCPRTRLPETGYYRVAGLDEVPENYGTKQDKFHFRAGDLDPSWHNIEDVDVVLLHYWVSVRTGIRSIDEADRLVQLSKPSRRRLTSDFNRAVFARYYVENVFEALDTPGEWYLDRKAGVVYYYPLIGEDTRNLTAVAPALDTIVRADGASNVSFRNLRFAHTQFDLPADSAGDTQAATYVPGAVMFQNASDCSVENCGVSRIGTYGVEIGSGCRSCRVERCSIHDLGAGGIKVNPGSEGTVLADNDIYDGGKIYRQAVGVWIGNSGSNKVLHNHIHGFDYTGVSVGWVWGYGNSEARNNLVEFNHIHDIGRGVLSDMAGIYTLGVSPGTRLADNLIHDVQSDTYGGWGLYTDEGSTDIVMENNVVYNTKTGGFHQHYGKDNVVRNNIFAYAKEQQIQRTRMEDHTSFTFERNIVYYDQGTLLGRNWKDDHYRIDYNIYWDASGRPIDFAGASLEEWRRRGHDVHSLIADPLFVNPAQHDFTLRPDSPALKVGFKQIDLSTIGPRVPVGPR